MSTMTSNFKFVKPDVTDVTDITAMNGNWDTIDTELKKIGQMSSKSTVVEATLAADKWGGQVYTWENSNIKSATQIIELLPSSNITSEQLEALQIANIVGTSQNVGSVTFKAHGEVPKMDVPVVFVIRGDV